MIKVCKWYFLCPIKRFTDEGKLERSWIEQYCLVGNTNCVRFQLEERGELHPDNLLPNGDIFLQEIKHVSKLMTFK